VIDDEDDEEIDLLTKIREAILIFNAELTTQYYQAYNYTLNQ